jgi:hypothetical protein
MMAREIKPAKDHCPPDPPLRRSARRSSSRRRERPARGRAAGAVMAAVIAVAALAAAPQARAVGGITDGTQGGIAFGINTGELTNIIPGIGWTNLHRAMWPGSSPSITTLSGTTNAYQMAFQANTSELWTCGTLGCGGLGLGMMPGTSPSITVLWTSNGSTAYQIAFQANTGTLWTTGSLGTANLGVPMNPHSSPSIAPQPGGGYEIAYETSGNQLAVAGTARNANLGLAMRPGTSPSITPPTIGPPGLPGYAIAFQGANGDVWELTGNTGGSSSWDLGLGMNPASSPAISPAGFAGNSGFQIAFEANTNVLWTTGALGTQPTGQAMWPGSSPSIIGLGKFATGPDGHQVTFAGYKIAFEDSTAGLATTQMNPGTSSLSTWHSGLGMYSTSSPSIAATPQ